MCGAQLNWCTIERSVACKLQKEFSSLGTLEREVAEKSAASNGLTLGKTRSRSCDFGDGWGEASLICGRVGGQDRFKASHFIAPRKEDPMLRFSSNRRILLTEVTNSGDFL